MVTLRVQGGGPAGTLLASANATGGVRGLVGNPQPVVEQVRDGKLDVGGAVGADGLLTVTRDLGLGQPYVGTVELVSGEIGDDIAHYLAVSEQTPSAVGIGVFVRADGSVEAAGGYLIQLMPGVSAEETDQIEELVRSCLTRQPCCAPVTSPDPSSAASSPTASAASKNARPLRMPLLPRPRRTSHPHARQHCRRRDDRRGQPARRRRDHVPVLHRALPHPARPVAHHAPSAGRRSGLTCGDGQPASGSSPFPCGSMTRC
jgi:hypothetical protein